MIHLLVDNCSLRDVIDIHGYSGYLSKLETLIHQKKLRLYAHELLLMEWNKHKKKWKEDKEDKLLGSGKFKFNNNPISATATLTNLDHIHDQISKIDELLKEAFLLTTPDVIKNEFSDRYRNGLAPFHNKRDSQNDWELIGTFANHCHVEGIRELYFLSSNHTDFGNGKKDELEIHDDIKSRFPNICIHYFADLHFFFINIDNTNGLAHELISYTRVANSAFTFKATRKKNVLDSLLHVFNDLYPEITFIPVHILRKLYPFASNENEEAYYDKFAMNYVSEDLFNFFKNVKIEEDGAISYVDEALFSNIRNYGEKIKIVLNRLTRNCIYEVRSRKSNRSISVFYNPKIHYGCLVSSFNKMNLQAVLTDMVPPKYSPPIVLLKYAYINVQVGNYTMANSIYEEICEKVLLEKKPKSLLILYFIAKYNQKHLSNFLGNLFAVEDVNYELINRLKAIDPFDEALKLKTHTDYNLLTFIASGEFFTESFQKIIELAAKLKENHHSRLRGGWSSNQLIWELAEEFARLDAFVNLNFIIYDTYSNFKKLFEHVIDGIFASYAQANGRDDHFDSIDDYWILKIIIYGDVKAMKQLASYYNISSVKYTPSSNSDENFVVLFRNLIGNQDKLVISKTIGISSANLQFERIYAVFFSNTLYLAGLLEMDAKKINEIGDLIFTYIKASGEFGHDTASALVMFFKSNSKKLTTRKKDSILKFLILNHSWKTSGIIHAIVSGYKKGLLNLTPNQVTHLLFQHHQVCLVCGHSHADSLIQLLYEKGTKLVQDLVRNEITAHLKREFSFEIYYLASLHQIIPFDLSVLANQIKQYKIPKNIKTSNAFFSDRLIFSIPIINEILNLAFQNRVDTKSKLFAKFMRVSLYYKWLLNMDRFNYKQFDIQWALHYHTIYFLEKMSQSEKLKTWIRAYLMRKNHEGLERLLLKITNFNKLIPKIDFQC